MSPRLSLQKWSRQKGTMRDLRLAGQSTVEFILMMLLMMGFVFFFLQVSLVFAYGNYVHYATFMSARALLAAGRSQDQQERAEKYIAIMLKQSAYTPGIERFPTIAQGQGGDFAEAGMSINLPDYDANQVNYSWSQGIRYTFKSRIFPMAIGAGAAQGSNQSTITLKSESWLGREATTSDCAPYLVQHDPHGKGIFDNGC